MQKIAVIGATGELGRLVVSHLVQNINKNDLIIIAKDTNKAKELFGNKYEIRLGDYTEPKTLSTAFENVDKLLFISSPFGDDMLRIQQHINVINTAKESGVKHIYYTSTEAVGRDLVPDSANIHAITELALKSSGIATTILRTGYYQELFVNDGLYQYIESGKILTCAGNEKISSIERNDIALAIATVLTKENQENKVYNLFASESWSYNELASILSELSGKNVEHIQMPSDEVLNILLSSGVPEALAYWSVGLQQAVSLGTEARVSNDIEMLIGRNPKTLKESIANHLDAKKN